MVNHMSSSEDLSEILKFQKNLEKIKKYKIELRENFVGLSEKELKKLKKNKFGTDVSDFIAFVEAKESKNNGIEFLRSYPSLKKELWEGWFYIILFVLIFLSLLAYHIEAKTSKN